MQALIAKSSQLGGDIFITLAGQQTAGDEVFLSNICQDKIRRSKRRLGVKRVKFEIN